MDNVIYIQFYIYCKIYVITYIQYMTYRTYIYPLITSHYSTNTRYVLTINILYVIIYRIYKQQVVKKQLYFLVIYTRCYIYITI